MSYDQPDKGAGFAPSDHPEWVNQLFLIWPKSVENVVFQKQNGEPDPTDMVTADVAIVTLVDPKTGAPVMLKNARIGGKAFTPQIKNKVGKKVLGKFVQLPKQPGKNAAYCLDVPAPESPEWAQMVQLAEQYEAQHPYVDAYAQPAAQQGGGNPAWQTQAQTGTQTAAWGAQAQTPAPAAQSWPTPGAATAAPTTSAQPAGAAWSPPPQAATAPPWPPGLREFLDGKGFDTSNMDEATARQIAAAQQ